MSNQSITMTPEELQATIAGAVAAALSAAGVTAQAPADAPKAKAPAKAESTAWTNAVGYTCKGGEFPAYVSSVAIRRHIAGSCKCKKEGDSCNWVKNGRLTADSFGSRPDILGVEKLEDEQRVVFVGDGGTVITDLTLS